MIGAAVEGEGVVRFRVWAPRCGKVDVLFPGQGGRRESLSAGEDGCFERRVEGVSAGEHYFYLLDGEGPIPDPASRRQPEGVFGPSAVVPLSHPWKHAGWKAPPIREWIISELHVGTFSPEGTFDGVVKRLDELRESGINALELMPTASFSGHRNWGYDGVFPFSVQESYGGPEGMKRMIDACHGAGMAVIVDVVYNHFGPEGGVHERFAPYHQKGRGMQWGTPIRYGPEVREYFYENVRMWTREFRVDALRLDAVHVIEDREFLRGLPHEVPLIAESDSNDPTLLDEPDGFDAQWNDDFQHALQVLLTGEKNGICKDFGSPEDLARAFREGFVYTGQFSSFRGRPHGASSSGVSPDRFVVFLQNHDQVGNRTDGARLVTRVSREKMKLGYAAIFFSPFIPMLFMGEEYGERAPFHYFIDHSDPALVRAVREGRSHDFASYEWEGCFPDPQDHSTFEVSRLSGKGDPALGAAIREMVRLRREIPGLGAVGVKPEVEVKGTLLLVRRAPDLLLALNFGSAEGNSDSGEEGWKQVFNSADASWGGEGGLPGFAIRPHSAVLFQK